MKHQCPYCKSLNIVQLEEIRDGNDLHFLKCADCDAHAGAFYAHNIDERWPVKEVADETKLV